VQNIIENVHRCNVFDGFVLADCATATKVLLSIFILTSVAINIPLSAYRSWFSVSYSTIFEELRVSMQWNDFYSYF